MFVQVGWTECLIVLAVILVVVALAFRSGVTIGKRRK